MLGRRLGLLSIFGLLVAQSVVSQQHAIKDNPMEKLYEASQAGDKQGFIMHTCTYTHMHEQMYKQIDTGTRHTETQIQTNRNTHRHTADIHAKHRRTRITSTTNLYLVVVEE